MNSTISPDFLTTGCVHRDVMRDITSEVDAFRTFPDMTTSLGQMGLSYYQVLCKYIGLSCRGSILGWPKARHGVKCIIFHMYSVASQLQYFEHILYKYVSSS